MELLTHSRKETFQLCRRRHKFAYIDGIRQVVPSKALRMGSAFHDAIEQLANNRGDNEACRVVYDRYDELPEGFDQLDWEYERETVLQLVNGYAWRWADYQLVHLAAEQSFQLPLVNPNTGHASKIWNRAGKIDGIVQSLDKRIGVKESKLLSDDVSLESDLWTRLQIDGQISSYVNAARDLGFRADYVLYDVTRKPTIKPTNVPLVDEFGLPIVLDARGNRARTEKGEPRMRGDAAKGYVAQVRPMTAQEWGDKLREDIGKRPEFYFARVEVARTDDTLRDYARELWQVQRNIRTATLENDHYRTVGEHCNYCPYFGMCVANRSADDLPDGFVIVSNIHPELGEVSNGSASRSDGPQAAATEACTAG